MKAITNLAAVGANHYSGPVAATAPPNSGPVYTWPSNQQQYAPATPAAGSGPVQFSPSDQPRNSNQQSVNAPRQQNGGQRRYTGPIVCWACNTPGHRAQFCPINPGWGAAAAAMAATPPNVANPPPTVNNRHIVPGRHAYLRARIGGQACCCLLDTGSEVSILPFRFITDQHINPHTIRTLTAANGSAIELRGEARVDIDLE